MIGDRRSYTNYKIKKEKHCAAAHSATKAMKRWLSVFLRVIVSVLALFVMFWFLLPPLNPRSPEFWSFLAYSIIVCVIINAFSQILSFIRGVKNNKTGVEGVKSGIKGFSKPIIGAVIAIAAIAVFGLIASAVGAQVFNAKNYNNLLTLTDGDFVRDVSEISQSQIPLVDRDTASRLGKRKLGEMSDLVSQFEISEDYTQINYKDKPTRVTPLEYGDIIKWFNNRANGLPAYISVDMTTQETALIRLEEGMKYSESELFWRNIHRYLRFKYPTAIFDEVSFEVDESGTPYWVASTVSYKIGLWSGRDIGGAVLVNAVTGESQYYDLEKIPTWVDQVFGANLIMEQLEYNGKYRSGFINSVFGQKGVIQPTDGYNYLAIDDDVWLYTGMTSIASDESNVGFVLINLRTKEAKFYSVPGAEEMSAMASAEGQVQNLKYVSTFPLLLNISNRPTYFMSLKDDAGLVKMYAFVDVQQYQIVGTGVSVDAARENYITKLSGENIKVEDPLENVREIGGKIAAINTAVVGGNTKYFILLENDEQVYTIDITKSDRLPFAKIGDTIHFTASEKAGKTEISDVKLG